MALTRARPVFGSPEARAALAGTVSDIVQRDRDPAKTAADAAAMRREIARHKPPKGPFDIKLGEGGLVDLEFLVQSLQLIHRKGLDPCMEVALPELADSGLVLPDLIEDYRLLTRMLVTFRVVSPQSAEPPPPSRALVAQACGLADWDALLEAHGQARHRVSQSWSAFAAQSEE
jgi:glutamate-ammonia-ligase adenylyltransferase